MNILLPLSFLVAMLIALAVDAIIRGVRERHKHRELVARLPAQHCPCCHQPYGAGGRAERLPSGVEMEPLKWEVTCPNCHEESLVVEGEGVRSETAA